MARVKNFKEQIGRLSLHLLDTTIDLSVFLVALGFSTYIYSRQTDGIVRSIETAVWAKRVFRQKVLKGGFWNARRKGLLEKEGGGWQITDAGKEYLRKILPVYKKKRPWNGKIYLVTYDVPEKRHRERNLLREYLKRIGCGMLQASVWLTPYNPRENLKEFLADYKLGGWVIVSDIGKDGNVGQLAIRDLVRQVYKLEELNSRYREFLQEAEEKKRDLLSLSFSYLAVLKDDPQLPFELLPKDWWGERAYAVFKTLPTFQYFS